MVTRIPASSAVPRGRHAEKSPGACRASSPLCPSARPPAAHRLAALRQGLRGAGSASAPHLQALQPGTWHLPWRATLSLRVKTRRRCAAPAADHPRRCPPHCI